MADNSEESQNYRNGRPSRANRGKNPNARWLVSDPEPKRPAKRRKSTPTKGKSKPDEEITEGEVKCRCNGEVSDDKTMAECENCKTWQHIVCEFGVDDESASPKPKYSCYDCRTKEEETDNGDKSASSITSASRPGSNEDVKAEATDTPEKTEDSDSQATKIAEIEDVVRRSVAEAFFDILLEKAEDDHRDVDDATIEKLALEIERNLYFQLAESKHDPKADVGAPYREQYRRSSFNLKDPKNRWLRERIVTGKLTPQKFVGMSSEELRNPELQELAKQTQEENLRETVITDVPKPPMEVIDVENGEVNAYPTDLELKKEDRSNEADQDEAMKEPLGPPPPIRDPADISSDFTGKQHTAIENEKAVSEIPVWSGTSEMANHAISSKAKGSHIVGANRNKWPSSTGPDLVVQGLVESERARSYLSAIALSPEKHHFAILAVVSEDTAKLGEMYDYLQTRDRFGSLRCANNEVTDAYIVPFESPDAFKFASLTEEQTIFINHSRTEHDNNKVLLAVYVSKHQNDSSE